MSNFRCENKYLISLTDFNLIKLNLDPLLKKDTHCINGAYTISSIYFDDYKMTSYNQVKAGISERWKYRIRYYNNDDSFISLEKKYKINGLTDKKSVQISKDILYGILNRSIKISENNNPLLNEFILKIYTSNLRPIILIEYDRIPYVDKLGNTRITLDYNIRYTNNFDKLFDKNKKARYLDYRLLEVKYDLFIPDYIRYRLELNHLELTSFSKFNVSIDNLRRFL